MSLDKAAVLLLMLLLVGTAWAQAPPPKPKPKPNVGGAPKSTGPAPAKASLLVKADEACTLSLNGGAARQMAAGETARLPVQELGDQFLEAKTADGLVWSEVVEVREPGQHFVTTRLAEARADRAIAERNTNEERARLTMDRGSLTWLRRDNGSDVNWHAAKAFCDGLSTAGHDDWRLPTFRELETVNDPSASTEYKVIPGIELTGFYLWSSTRQSPSSVFVVGFTGNERGAADLEYGGGRALCVRSSGGSPLEPRLMAAPDGASYAASPDTLIRGSLMWARRDNGSHGNWYQAEAYCEGLSLAGRDDWRLPTIAEVESLYEPGVESLYDPGASTYEVVPGVELTGCCLWSSTMVDSSSVWKFCFCLGNRYSVFVLQDGQGAGGTRALCVRSPEG